MKRYTINVLCFLAILSGMAIAGGYGGGGSGTVPNTIVADFWKGRADPTTVTLAGDGLPGDSAVIQGFEGSGGIGLDADPEGSSSLSLDVGEWVIGATGTRQAFIQGQGDAASSIGTYEADQHVFQDGNGGGLGSITSSGLSFAGYACTSSTHCGTKTLSGGTGTVTVVAGCRPICTNTNTTVATATDCSVSGTTLSIKSGASTDTVDYFCF